MAEAEAEMRETDQRGSGVPNPLDVLRALPLVGLHLLIPAMVMGSVFGSLIDILLGHDGYPLAMVGVIGGPVVFGLAINALQRCERARDADDVAWMEAYRLEETEKRRSAARGRGDLIDLHERRTPRR